MTVGRVRLLAVPGDALSVREAAASQPMVDRAIANRVLVMAGRVHHLGAVRVHPPERRRGLCSDSHLG